MLFWIISRGQTSSHPLDITWYSLQVLAEVRSISVVWLTLTVPALVLLYPGGLVGTVGGDGGGWCHVLELTHPEQISSESNKKKDKGESQSLLGK